MHVVVWETDGKQYATACDQIGEVAPLVEMEPFEDLPAWVRGVATIHGHRMLVVDASVLLGHAPIESTLGTRLLVIDDGGDEDRQFALMVSAVVDVQNAEEGNDNVEMFDQMPARSLIDPVIARLEST